MVKSQEATLIRLAKAHGCGARSSCTRADCGRCDGCSGFSGGAEAGKKGYELTFNIAYLRDMCFDYGVISESFEASIRWSQVHHTSSMHSARWSAQPLTACPTISTQHSDRPS